MLHKSTFLITVILTLPKGINSLLSQIAHGNPGVDVYDAGFKSGKNIFIMPLGDPRNIYYYDEAGALLNTFDATSYFTIVVTCDIKADATKFLAATHGGKTLLLDVLNMAFVQEFSRGGATDHHDSLVIWQGTIFW